MLAWMNDKMKSRLPGEIPKFPIKKKKKSVKTNIILYIKLILDIGLPGIRTSISTLEQCVLE